MKTNTSYLYRILESLEKNITITLGIVLLIVIFTVHSFNYLLFHTIIEMVTIGIAWAVFLLTWNSHKLSNNNAVTFVGIAYLFVGGFDLLHTLAYKGMDIYVGYDSNLPTQLWIIARYVNSLSLIALSFISPKKVYFSLIFLIYIAFSGLVLLSLFVWQIFPDCFVEGYGLTDFKIVSEYIVCVLFLISIFLLLRQNKFDRKVTRIWVASIAMLILAELAFTVYVDVYDISNMAGHLLKLFSSVLIYVALIETGVKKPFSLLFRDLKERESELIESNRRLAVELEKREKAELKLRSALKDLKRSNEDLEQFAYVASHDLQEPLRMVASYTGLMERYLSGKLDDKAKVYMNYITDGARRMHLLIKDLLSFSRVSSNKDTLTLTDVNSVVQSVIGDLQILIKESNAVVETGFLPDVYAVPTQLKQLVQNLISNAIKFRGEDNPVVRINAVQDENEWKFSIRDNGIGINPEHFDRIFVIFQRLHEKERYPGSGIGLSICKKIVERHGGRIWVESAPNKGTSFYFTLPISD